jgi:sucrose phosphorylase
VQKSIFKTKFALKYRILPIIINMSNLNNISNGVMLNAYPDSIGGSLHDCITMLKLPQFKDAFSLFYVLPTFFNSDLDRGFSIIDYDLNTELVSEADLADLEQLNIELKFDIILNHLSVASPQFKDLLANGDTSPYKDFFINWNTFWQGNGQMEPDGVMIPNPEHLSKLFMRKAGLPILKVRFPDGSEKPFWNTFYQQISYHKITAADVPNCTPAEAEAIANIVNAAVDAQQPIHSIDLGDLEAHKPAVIELLEQKRTYLGQMDVNGESPLVWEFYEQTLQKLKSYGCKILRLDAFAYLHKAIGQSNFFNKPGTWQYLERFKQLATKYDLILLPEIHAEYGLHLHDEVAQQGYFIYDFFLPGLMIHALESGSNQALLKWANEIISKGYKTVNMLGCHDGIPVLDLKGKEVDGHYQDGLLADSEIEEIMTKIMERGGRVKNLYGPSGEKISYYQINATFFSAIGENEQKMLLARAIQLFMPGIPQVWYLDIFAGKNDYAAADNGGSGGHKEINRTTLSLADIEAGLQKDVVLKQLEMIRLRNTFKAFLGTVQFNPTGPHKLDITWQNQGETANLKADLLTHAFTVSHSTAAGTSL